MAGCAACACLQLSVFLPSSKATPGPLLPVCIWLRPPFEDTYRCCCRTRQPTLPPIPE